MILCSDTAVKTITKKRKRDEETFQKSKRAKQSNQRFCLQKILVKIEVENSLHFLSCRNTIVN